MGSALPGAEQGCAEAPQDAQQPPASPPCPERAPALQDGLQRCRPAEGGPAAGADPPGQGPRRGRARPGRQVMLFGRRRDRAGGSVRPPVLGGGHRTPTGTGSPSGGPPAPVISWDGDVPSASSGRNRAAQRVWSAGRWEGRGRAAGIYPKSVLRSPPKKTCLPPQSLPGPQGSWPCRAGRGQWQQRALHRPWVGTEHVPRWGPGAAPWDQGFDFLPSRRGEPTPGIDLRGQPLVSCSPHMHAQKSAFSTTRCSNALETSPVVWSLKAHLQRSVLLLSVAWVRSGSGHQASVRWEAE